MTAPGNSVLLLALLAAFLACTCYAVGRVHQRFHNSQERRDAYLDGYESGTSSVFSEAVRLIGPRRPAHLSAAGKPRKSAKNARTMESGDRVAPEPPAVETGASLGFPVPPPPPSYAVSQPRAVGGVTYRPLPNPRPGEEGPPPLRDAPTHPNERPRFIDRSRLALGLARRLTSGAIRIGPIKADPIKAGSDNAGPDKADPETVSREKTALRGAGADTAGPKNAGATKGRQEKARPEKAGPDDAGPDSAGPETAAATGNISAEEAPEGRHMVPDGLVQAATYRLPPDRVFRARVPDGKRLSEGPTTPLTRRRPDKP